MDNFQENKLFFSPNSNILPIIIELLSGSRETIKLAIFQIDLQTFAPLLIKAKKKM